MATEIDPRNSLWKSRRGWVLVAFGVIAAFFLLAGHRAHVFGFLPYLLLLACPLMHLFGHGGHGGHGHRDHEAHAAGDHGAHARFLAELSRRAETRLTRSIAIYPIHSRSI